MAKQEFIHFSDKGKVLCGAKDAQAVTDEQKVTCKKCSDLLAKKAQTEGDPLVKVRVKNLELNDGVDWGFWYEGKHVLLVNNEVYSLPRSIVEHLKLLAYPYKQYRVGAEPGQSMVVAGKQHRFAITPM